MQAPHDLTTARKAIVSELGKEAILELHHRQPLWDWVAIVGHWTIFGVLVYLLGTLPIGAWWALCFVLQGFVVMAFGYLLHDLFIHRYVGGRRFAYWMGMLCGAVAYLHKTSYRHIHVDHHNFTGTDPDEAYKNDLNTRVKKVFFCTAPGYLMGIRRMLAAARDPEYPAPEGTFKGPRDKAARRRFRFERRFLNSSWAVIAVLAWFFPRFTLFGYVLPLVVMLPIANTIRTVLEHAETHPGHPYHCATYYRTGFLTQALFFWDAGDCHLVHHLFPNIPWYRMARACRVLRPFLLRHGVRERRSLPKLLYGWFVKNEQHRTLWGT